MQLNRLTFNQNWLKRLNTKSVQGWRAVQENRVLTNHFSQDIPDLCCLALHHFLRSLDSSRESATLQLAENKWLEQLQRHFLGKTTLMQFQGRSNHDYGPTRVVHSLTQQVLAKTPLLTLDHVGQRFQWTLVRTGNCATATPVI